MKKSRRKRISTKHFWALLAVYFVLFATLGAMIDYYAYDLLSPWIFVSLSLAGAVWAAWVHVGKREKTKADELAHDLEEIL